MKRPLSLPPLYAYGDVAKRLSGHATSENRRTAAMGTDFLAGGPAQKSVPMAAERSSCYTFFF